MSVTPVVEEVCGSSGKRRFLLKPTGKSLRVEQLESVEKARKSEPFTKFFAEVFLPQGYPESVTADYLEYQMWDTLQAFASSIVGTLATSAILKGIGVGDETATPLAATMTWLTKDGASMIGRIAFAWLKGTEFDSDSKKWRLAADILNDLAFFIDLCGAHLRPIFTLLVCISGVLRACVGVAGGATRASLTQHQARRNNLADVSAKDGSQETLVNLSALICSLMLMPLVANNQPLVWFIWFLLTSFHIFANYKACRSLRLDSLNRTRYAILVREFMQSGRLLPIRECNLREPLIGDFIRPLVRFISRQTPPVDVKLGCSLADIRELSSEDRSPFSREYEIIVQRKHDVFEVCACLRADVGLETVFKCVFTALVVRDELERTRDVSGLVRWREGAEKRFRGFFDAVQQEGYDTRFHLFALGECRYL